MSRKVIQLVQCKLESGESHLVCLLEADRFKVGNQITLADSEDKDRLWEVISIGQPVKAEYIHREWNNNI